MVEIEIEYQGDLHTRAVHGPSKSELVTDAPADNQGRGAAFSPTDLLATSLGTCIVTTMGIYARRKEIDLTGARVRVVKEMVADPERRVGRLGVTVTLPASVPEDQRPILERVAHTCPVHRSLHPDVKKEIVIRYA